jgi:hypothetical protein
VKDAPKIAGVDSFIADWLAPRLPEGSPLQTRLLEASDKFRELAGENHRKKISTGPAYDEEVRLQNELDTLITEARAALVEPGLFGPADTIAMGGYRQPVPDPRYVAEPGPLDPMADLRAKVTALAPDDDAGYDALVERYGLEAVSAAENAAEIAAEPIAPRGAATTFRADVDSAPDIPATYRLIELDDLLTSDRTGYPSGLQLRDRGKGGKAGRLEAEQQVETMSKQFRSDDSLRIVDNGWEGTQIVRESDAAVVSGNGRTGAMRRLTDAQYAIYRARLRERAAEYGLTPEQVDAMERPVIVREIPDELATADLARRLNEATGGATRGEKASAVAAAITAEDLRALDISDGGKVEGALRTIAGAAFVQRVFGKLTAAERRSLLSDGELTDTGRTLIKTAMLAKVIPDVKLVTRLVDSADDTPIGKIRNGLMESIGQLATAKSLFEEGQRFATLDITGDIAVAVGWLDRVKASGGDPLEGLGLAGPAVRGGEQVSLLDVRADLTPQQAWIAEVLWKLGGSSGGSVRGVREFLQAYANKVIASEDPNAVMMFGGEPDLTSLLRGIVGDVNEARTAAAEGSMFGAETVPLPPNAAGDVTLAPAFETDTGNMRTPVTASQPMMSVEDLTAEINSRVTPGGRLDITVEPERLIDLVDQFGEHPEVVWTTGDDALDTAMADILARDVARREYADLAEAYGRGDETVRQSAFEELVAGANEGSLTGPQFLLLRFLSGGDLRRMADGSYNPTRVTFIRDLVTEGRGLIDQLSIVKRRYPDTFRVESGAGPAETRIIRGRDVDVDPATYEATTGMPPDMSRVDAQAGEIAQAPGHVLATSENRPLAQAIVRARGGEEKLPDGTRLLEINRPDEARILQTLEQRIAAKQAQVDEIRAKIDEALAKPIETNLDTAFADDATRELWGRLMRPGQPEFSKYLSEPTGLGEIVDAITSIERGVLGDLTPQEGALLREQLMAVMGEIVGTTKTAREALRRTERTGRVKPAGPTVPARGPTRKGQPAVEWNPASVPDDLALLAHELAPVVTRDDTLPPLEGFDGVQYVLAKAPSKGKVTGQPIAPRLFWREDLITQADRIVPGFADEIAAGPRRKTLPARINDSIVGRGIEWLVGGRPEQVIRSQTLAHFKERLLGETADLLTPDEYKAFEWDVAAIYRAWRHDLETRTKVGVPLHRRISLLPAREADDIALRVLKERHEGELPGWYAASGVKPSEAWRYADNRLRQFFRNGGEGDLGRMTEVLYESGPVKRLGSMARGLIPLYHMYRFMLDVRWLMLEFTESPLIALGRGGPGAFAEGMKASLPGGMKRGQGREPFLMGKDALAANRENWAHWMAVTDTGAMLRLRDRFMLATLRREQPEVLIKALKELAANDAELSQTLRRFGDSPEAWLTRLDRDWQGLMARSKPLTTAEAKAVWEPFLRDKVIDQLTYDRLVAARRYTPIAALDQAIAETAGDVRIQRLYQQLQVKNNELWNELASVFYGQPDRSNLQRILNHPLLYWPLSYQIKATKWLANILFDRALGVDTGSGGAWTIQQVHDEHVRRMTSDPEYAAFFERNKTLLFLAQMIIPITPFDIGVSLSPFTRLVLQRDQSNTEEDEAYRRNIFSVGPGYTFFALLPRLIAEQQKAGAAMFGTFGKEQGVPGLNELDRFFPATIPVKPSKKSTLEALSQEAFGGYANDPRQLLLPQGESRYGP